MSTSRILIGISTILFVFILLIFYRSIFRLFGYYVTFDEAGLAQYLVERHLPPSECDKLIFFERIASTVPEKRLDCIVQYAKLTQDPSICEGLMPNIYGMGCLN